MLNGRDVYLKTGCCFVAVSLLTAMLDRLLLTRIPDASFRLATAFSILQIVAVSAITIYLIVRRAYTRFEKNLCDQIRPAMEDRVMLLALTGDSWQAEVPRRGPARQVLEQCIAHALAGLKDSGRHRLARFAVEQGFAAQWRKAASCGSFVQRKRAIGMLGLISKTTANHPASLSDPAALRDRQPMIRAEAARALLLSNEPEAVDLVFHAVLHDSLLVRALLSGDLKRHARHLLTATVPAILARKNSGDILACLQMLVLWKLAVPGVDIAPLLDPANQRLFPFTLSLLPYLSLPESTEELLRTSLGSVNTEVQCAAADAIGQLKLEGLISDLERRIVMESANRNVRVALAAAAALAELGSAGMRRLDLIVAAADRNAAAIALEALENASVSTHILRQAV